MGAAPALTPINKWQYASIEKAGRAVQSLLSEPPLSCPTDKGECHELALRRQLVLLTALGAETYGMDKERRDFTRALVDEAVARSAAVERRLSREVKSHISPTLASLLRSLEYELALLHGHHLDPTCPCETAGEHCPRKHLLSITEKAARAANLADREGARVLQMLIKEANDRIKAEEAAACHKGALEKADAAWSSQWWSVVEALSLSFPGPDVEAVEPTAEWARSVAKVAENVGVNACELVKLPAHAHKHEHHHHEPRCPGPECPRKGGIDIDAIKRHRG